MKPTDHRGQRAAKDAEALSDHRHQSEGNAGGEGAAELAPAADSFLPAQLLQPGEIIILLIKPSPWYIVLSCLGFLVGVAVVAGALLMLQRAGMVNVVDRHDLIVGAVGLAGVRLFWQLLDWLSRVYVLTDQRVIRVRGVLRVQVFECPLKQVQHTSAYFSLRERVFGLGTLAFATAGTAGIEAVWEMLAQPLEVHQVVVQALNRYGR